MMRSAMHQSALLDIVRCYAALCTHHPLELAWQLTNELPFTPGAAVEQDGLSWRKIPEIVTFSWGMPACILPTFDNWEQVHFTS